MRDLTTEELAFLPTLQEFAERVSAGFDNLALSAGVAADAFRRFNDSIDDETRAALWAFENERPLPRFD